MVTSYLDLLDNPTELSEDELEWFKNICKDCIAATGINIRIECDDHHTAYKGKSKEALGLFHTTDIQNPLI